MKRAFIITIFCSSLLCGFFSQKVKADSPVCADNLYSTESNVISFARTMFASRINCIFNVTATENAARGRTATIPGSGANKVELVDSTVVAAALTGVKTIDNTLPTSGSNYATFTAAISDLNANGVGAGGVTFNVTAGQIFSEAPGGTIITTTTGTASNPIIFQRAGAGVNPVLQGTNGIWNGSSLNGDACISIDGGDYITFDGIDVKDNPSNATTTTRMEFGFRLRSSFSDGAQNNTIKNTTITLNRLNTSSIGIIQTASSIIGGGSVAGGVAGTNSFNKYYNLTIKNAYAGIYLVGDSNGAYPDDSCEIGVTGGATQNIIGDSIANDIGNGTTQTWGIRTSFQNSVKIFKNEVRNVTGTGTAVDGIFLENFGSDTVGAGTNEISGNQVHEIKSTSTSATSHVVSGIRAILPASAGSVSRIFNNFIYGLVNSSANTASRQLIGIRVQDGGGGAGAIHNIDFNSVRMSPAVVTCSNAALEIATTSGPVINVRNNVLANFTGAQAGSAKHYSWVTTSGTSTGAAGSISNHNILFIGNATNGFIGLASTDRATLANWRAAVNQDFHSKSSDPQFNSAIDLHINPAAATDIESGGSYFNGAIAWIAQDIDAQSRNTSFPDIGADEGNFTATAADTTTPDIFYTALSNTTGTSNRNLTNVAITDLSGVNTTAGTKPRLYYKRSIDTNSFNDNTGATNGWKFVEANGAASPFDFTIDYSLLSGGTGVASGQTIQYFVVAQDLAATPNVGINSGTFAAAPASVNLTSAAFPIGGTINSYGILISYSGSYNVCNGAPYATLKSFFDAVNAGIVTGNITVNIAGSCAETAAAVLNQWTEEPANSNFTMKIQPSGGAARTVSGTITTAVIKLNGADRVTIDGLNTGGNSLAITNNSASNNTAVVWLASLGTGQGATNDAIRNTTITGGAIGSNSVSTFGIVVGTTSISLNTFGADNDNVTIQGNTITKVQNGIYVEGNAGFMQAVSPAGGDDNLTISGNIVGPATAGANNIGATGILVQNAVAPNLSGNTVRNVVAPAALTYQGFPAGITLINASNGVIAQNTVTNVSHPGTTNAMYATGILVDTTDTGAQITGNTVSSVTATATNTSGNIVSAYGITNGAPGSMITGNTVASVISSSTSGCPAYGIWLTTTPTNVTLANNSVSDVQSYSFGDTTFRWQPVGIYVEANASNIKLYFNSINLFGAHPGTAAATMQAALFIDGSGSETGFDLRDNIFANSYDNSSSASDKSYAIYSNAAAAAFGNINYNDYYASGGAGVMGFIGGSDRTTIAQWRSGTGQDTASVSGNPQFISTTNLHINNSVATPVSNSATPITGITIDIDGDARSATTPDIGADEFSPPTNPSGTGAANPNSVQPGGTTLLIVTVTPGTNPASTGITVTADLSGIGGSGTQTFFDNGTNGDATAGDNIFSYSATVGSGTTTGSKTLPVTIADAQSRSGSTAISLNVATPPQATHFSVSASATAIVGSAFNFTVTALDASNNAVAGYVGTVHFTSTSAAASLPADYTFTASDNGTRTFSATLDTTGNQTITATDTINAAITGTSGSINVSPAPAADLTITKTHAGNFSQGQTGAQYTITVTNSGNAPTGGTVTVTDNLPAGLTATAIDGTGWSCILGTLTCTRSDVLANGAPYPAIALTVNVDGTAPPSVTNTAAVSGGGETDTSNDTADDPTTITTNTIVWTGATDINWNVPANWKPATMPVSTNDVLIPSSGVTNEPTISDVDVTVNSLNESSGRTLTVGGGRTLTVTNGCTVGGTIVVTGSFGCGSMDASSGTAIFNGGAAQTIPAGTYNNLTINNSSGVSLGGNVTITGTLTLTSGVVTTNSANTLTIGAFGSISGASSASYVIGNLQKIFQRDFTKPGPSSPANAQKNSNSSNNSPASAPSLAPGFVYPVGTANGFSPVTVNATGGTGSFTVSATQNFLPGANTSQSIGRYWTLISNGITQADITFQYLDADVPSGANESSFSFIRRSSSINTFFTPTSFDTAVNTFTLNNVTQFSDWSLGAPLAPTAATVTVAGRVITSAGRGLTNSVVVLTDANGNTRTARTTTFGYYRFRDVEAGQTYVFSVRSKRFQFTPQVISVTEDLNELNFTGQ